MNKLSKQDQQRILIVAGAAVALYLLYRYLQSRSAATTAATTGTSPNTGASDFASLAGQEQGDVANLQGQNAQLLAQEQSDVAQEQSDIAGLTGMIGAGGAQEQADVSGLTGQIAGFADAIGGLIDNQTTLSREVAAMSLGLTKLNRQNTATVKTHQGGKFFGYYKRVTGHAPPARVRVNSRIYEAWKLGIKASALREHPPHPSAPRNHHVAHPNPAHHPKTTHNTHPNAPKKPAPKPPSRPPSKPPPRPPPRPPYRPPQKKKKATRPSGRRK
jgi:hypothetical protein